LDSSTKYAGFNKLYLNKLHYRGIFLRKAWDRKTGGGKPFGAVT
jgi:hypothetical protein